MFDLKHMAYEHKIDGCNTVVSGAKDDNVLGNRGHQTNMMKNHGNDRRIIDAMIIMLIIMMKNFYENISEFGSYSSS
jgi:hypothetical protein